VESQKLEKKEELKTLRGRVYNSQDSILKRGGIKKKNLEKNNGDAIESLRKKRLIQSRKRGGL